NTEFELSELDSDDSEYTRKINIDNNIQTIIQYHQELNNNGKCIHESKKYLVGENYLFEDYVLNIGKDLLKIKKAKINIESSSVDKLDKNNSLYQV
ncbi:6430_t:CDS:1, partial [Dentiscutata erythropus]